MGLNFVCNSYRFISIIISLLLLEKKEKLGKECINSFSNEKIQKLNDKLNEF